MHSESNPQYACISVIFGISDVCRWIQLKDAMTTALTESSHGAHLIFHYQIIVFALFIYIYGC